MMFRFQESEIVFTFCLSKDRLISSIFVFLKRWKRLYKMHVCIFLLKLGDKENHFCHSCLVVKSHPPSILVSLIPDQRETFYVHVKQLHDTPLSLIFVPLLCFLFPFWHRQRQKQMGDSLKNNLKKSTDRG